jgi:hypothetical protein
LVFVACPWLGAAEVGAPSTPAEPAGEPALPALQDVERALAERLASLPSPPDRRSPAPQSSEPSLDLGLEAMRFLEDLDQDGSARERAPELSTFLEEHLRGILHDRLFGEGVTPPDLREARLRAASRVADNIAEKLSAGGPSSDRSVSAVLVPPTNDACADATLLESTTLTGDTTGSTNDGTATCGNSAASADVWYRYVAPADGLVSFETFGSTYDTVLSLHAACPGTTANELACADDSRGTLQSQVPRVVTAGEEVFVRVAGAAGATGAYDLLARTGGGIAGEVEKETTGEPLSGANVYLYSSSGYLTASTSSAPDGSYLFAGLSSAHYVGAERAGYVRELYDDVPCLGYCNVTGAGATLVSPAAALISGIDFSLGPAGGISGVVTSSDTGGPLGSVDVIARLVGSSGYGYSDYSGYSDGRYHVSGLPPGSYHVWTYAYYSGHRNEVFDGVSCDASCEAVLPLGTPVEVTAGSTTPADFELERLGSISGMVTDNLGQPLSYPSNYTSVTIFRADGTSWAGSSLYSSSEYAFGGLLPGTYYARASSSGALDELFDGIACEEGCDPTTGTPIVVQLGVTTSGIDFALTKLGSITGTVRDAETLASLGGYVYAYRDGATGYSSAYISSGTYTITGLLPGTYRAHVSVWDDDFYENELFHDLPCDPSCDLSSGFPIPVLLDSTTSGVDFALDRCTLDSVEIVANELFLGAEVRSACREVLLGPNVTLFDGSALQVAARRSIRVSGPVTIQIGARLGARIDPAVGTP